MIHYITATPQTTQFRFSNIYGDHMVLQQAPTQANVWGYISDCEDGVTVKFVQAEYPATLIKGIYLISLSKKL